MRIVRVQYREHTFYASLAENAVVCLNKALGLSQPIPLEEVIVLPPVMPTKIVCAAVNYRAHGAELGHTVPDEPRIFLKPPSSIIGPGHPILLPPSSTRVDHECELAVVIGKTGRHLDPADVREYVFGYACANDVTARDLQKIDGIFGRAKGFDTFCPIGPWIETQIEDPDALTIRTLVNGQVRQNGTTADMIFKTFELVSFISKIMTLNPGDVILTGTPEGVGPLHAGDEVRIEIEGVGLLINPVLSDTDDGREKPVQ